MPLVGRTSGNDLRVCDTSRPGESTFSPTQTPVPATTEQRQQQQQQQQRATFWQIVVQSRPAQTKSPDRVRSSSSPPTGFDRSWKSVRQTLGLMKFYIDPTRVDWVQIVLQPNCRSRREEQSSETRFTNVSVCSRSSIRAMYRLKVHEHWCSGWRVPCVRTFTPNAEKRHIKFDFSFPFSIFFFDSHSKTSHTLSIWPISPSASV